MIEAQAFRCKHVTSDILNLPWREGLTITEVDVNRLDRQCSRIHVQRQVPGEPS